MGMLVTAGMASALVIKSADGVLRYSLHKTSTEMLYLPFSDAARQRVKAFIDVVGQRGGQAFGSLLVLAISAAGGSTRTTAGAIVVLALLWGASAISLRPGYLGLFRLRLDGPRFEHIGRSFGARPRVAGNGRHYWPRSIARATPPSSPRSMRSSARARSTSSPR